MVKDKKIKIIFAVNDFTIAGVQKLYLDIFNYLDLRKYDVNLITLFQFPTKKDFYNQVPSEISIHKLNFNNFYDIKNWYFLFKLLLKIKPDLVLSSLFFSNTIFRILKIFLGFKIISIEHNTYINKTKFQIFVDRLLALVTFRVIAVSQTVAIFTMKQEKIKASKFEVIHNGVDFEKIKKCLSFSQDIPLNYPPPI
jgi:glycosyltransferase involved in cell wall biosynthesis